MELMEDFFCESVGTSVDGPSFDGNMMMCAGHSSGLVSLCNVCVTQAKFKTFSQI